MPELFSLSRTSSNNPRQDALRVAKDLYDQDPEWVLFFREVLGVDGVIPKLFPNPDQMEEFRKTAEYADIQRMVADLRDRNGSTGQEDKEPTRVITVRLPKSLHESLRAEAHERQTSMNKLCISKLLQVIDEELVPQD